MTPWYPAAVAQPVAAIGHVVAVVAAGLLALFIWFREGAHGHPGWKIAGPAHFQFGAAVRALLRDPWPGLALGSALFIGTAVLGNAAITVLAERYEFDVQYVRDVGRTAWSTFAVAYLMNRARRPGIPPETG